MPFRSQKFVFRRARPDWTLTGVTGSPFSGRIGYVTGGTGQRFEHVPDVAKAQRAEVLFLDSLTAPVQIGDLVTLPDGSFRKVIQVRRYDRSLQVGLQRQPFAPLPCWVPQTTAQRTSAQTRKVADLAYDAAPDALGYLEPAPDMVKLTPMGRLDTRAAYAYTLAPLALGAVLRDAQGDYWVAELPSDVWPLTGDCKTLMRHQPGPPAGVAP